MSIQYPEKGLVPDYELYRKRRPSITFAVNRKVVAPVLFRNTEPDRSETQEFGGTLHAQVNGEKFISKERLTGLALLRQLSDEFDGGTTEWDDSDEMPDGLIASQYSYNEPAGLATSLNLDALTYGLAGTGDQEYGIKSRVIAGYTYSTDQYDLANKETRNAVYESGTMQDEEGEQSTSLYEFAKIHPGNSFVHFVTLEAATPPMLLYAMHNMLTTTDYGARETRSGKTIENDILAVILANSGTTLSTGELLMEYRTDNLIEEDVGDYIHEAQRDDWEVYSDDLDRFDSYPDWYENLHDVAARTTSGAAEALHEELRSGTTDAYKTLLLSDDE